MYMNEDGIDEDSETSSDEDYDPLLDIEICNDTEDEENDTYDFDSLEHELIDILDSSEDEIQDTFLIEVLMELRKLKSGAIWITCDINDLINGYLKSIDKAMNLTHAELDTTSELILTYNGHQLYNKSSKKSVKVAKLIENLTGLVTHVNERRKISTCANTPSTLFQCAQSKLLSKYYPKVFLEIAAAKCMLPNKLEEWEYSSHVQIEIQISNKDYEDQSFQHISFSKPSRSQMRNQVEHRTMDPTHILTNLRSQIYRHGFQQLKTAVFHRVSVKNHNALSLVIDQLDKQSADLAKCFFSCDVEKILQQNGDNNEAQLVHVVREWYEACDARGIHIYDRLQGMQNLYNYLYEWFDMTDFPAPTKYIRGMSIQTYQMIMQSISTRM